MLNRDVNVTFIHNGNIEQFTLFCERVKFSLELVGEVLEKLDYELVENYQENHRQRIEIKLQLNLIQGLAMTNFLQATDKKLIIDGVTFEVVNADSVIDFELFKGYNILTNPTLRFRVKALGVQLPEIVIMGEEVIL
jgi:hypothetical protein